MKITYLHAGVLEQGDMQKGGFQRMMLVRHFIFTA